MAGHNTTKTKEVHVVNKRTIPQPLDIYDNISDVANIAIEVPQNIRYNGQLVYSELDSKYFYFKGGIDDLDLIPLINQSSVRTITTEINTLDGIVYEYEHNLGSQNLIINFVHNDETLILGWKRGKLDGTMMNNAIHFTTNADYNGLQMFIIGNDITEGTDLHPNLDGDITTLKLNMLTTHSYYGNFQLVGDELLYLRNDVETLNTAVEGLGGVPQLFPTWLSNDSITAFGSSGDNTIGFNVGATPAENSIDLITSIIRLNPTYPIEMNNHVRVMNGRDLQFTNYDESIRLDIRPQFGISGDIFLPPTPSNIFGLSNSVTVPTPTSTGTAGETRIIGDFRYECIATDEWVRSDIVRIW